MKCGWLGAVAVASMALTGCARKAAEPSPQPVVTITVPPGALAVQPAADRGPVVPIAGGVILPTRPGSAGEWAVSDEGRIARRVWPVVAAWYPSGAVPAGPVYFENVNLDEPYIGPTWSKPFVDLGLFAWDVVKLPYELVVRPPWTTVIYKGVEQEVPVPGSTIQPLPMP